MTAFAIIRNAPPLTHRQGAQVYPFARMDVGDAFDAPRDQGVTARGHDCRQRNILSSAIAWAKRHNSDARFSTSLIDAHTVRCRREA